MLKRVNGTDIEKLNHLELNMRPIFAEITSGASRSNLAYYIFYDNDSPEAAFTLYEKNNRIIIPECYPYYSGIWVKGSLDNSKTRSNFYKAIEALKKLYKSIALIVPPQIQDIRGFIWNDFDVKVKYTYIKNTHEWNFKKDVLRNLKNAEKDLKATLRIDNLDNKEWLNHQSQLRQTGFKEKYLNQLKQWIILLESKKIIKSFYLQTDPDNIIGSGIVLLDYTNKSAGLLLNYVPKNNNQSKINALLYVSIQRWLAGNGFISFNYLGANTQSIAEFKSRFSPELKSYYFVEYSKYRFSLKKIISKINW